MEISLIAAVSENNVIGNKGTIPWQLPKDLKKFKEITTGKTVIMGRKTYEDMGRPLPNRINIIISSTIDVNAENCITVSTIERALELCKQEEEVFIIGGGGLYKEMLPYANKIYLSVVHSSFEGDVFFPSFNKEEFNKIHEEIIEDKILFTFYIYERK